MISQSKLIFYISIFSLIVAGAFITPANAWQNVFCNIALFGTNDKILCEGLRDTITFKEGSGVDIELDTVNQIVTFSSSSTGDGNTAQIADAGSGLGWFSSRYNATLNYLKTLSCGTNLTCITNATTILISAAGTGEANTMSNIGGGEGEIYKQKTGVNFEVRTLLAGAGMNILTNANDILLSVSALTSANNVGSGELGFIAYNNSKVDIKRLDCDSTLNCFNGTDSNTIGVASISEAQVTNLVADLAAKQAISQKGIANGYPSLNNNAVVPSSQLGSGSNSSTNCLKGDRTWGPCIGKINGHTDSPQTITGTSGHITITTPTNATINVDTAFKVNSKSAATRQFLTSYSNDTSNGNFGTTIFGINSQTCSASQFVSAISNSSGAVTCSTVSGLPVSLSGNLTTTSTAAFTTIFTIPLTANSGNAIDGLLVAESNTGGAAVQAGSRISSATATGYCNFVTPLTASTQELDYLVLSTTTAETSTTTWLPAANVPIPIQFRCVAKTGASPPNLLIEFQAEVASTVGIKAGSFYQKSP